MKKKWVDSDDAPALTGDELTSSKAKWRIGTRQVSIDEGKAAFRQALRGKRRVNIHLDVDVIEHYKLNAGGRGYQTLINMALRRDMERVSMTNSVDDLMKQRNAELKETIAEEFTRRLKSFMTERLPAHPEVVIVDAGAAQAGYSASEFSRWRLTQLEPTNDTGVAEQRVTTLTSSSEPVFHALTPTGGTA